MSKPRPNPRPGFILEVDRQTPPILFHHGEGFRMEKLPIGRSRVIYPREPLAGMSDPDGAIVDALLNPIDDDPLPSLLTKGMKLTIAFEPALDYLNSIEICSIRVLQRLHHERLIDAVIRGIVSIHVNQAYPLSETAEAHRAMEARETTGATVLLV